ncbi:hypothetical protein EJC51_16010 [Streptomyces aquilus]|uniref:Uncharacterized protein n=1 Tax=Streptomyces aquilus TaxID=2548456 RepID=A0A3Q9BZM1_9ACTN|nr:hypothetical protein [Streptomyces aquilus]AZP17493.1 hypothetical protein EJC51_16010 [Streptomyces aquilus]
MSSKLAGKVVARAQEFLRPGEQVRRVVIAQGGINPRLQIAFLMVAFIGVIARLPQGTRIGPMSGTWAQIELAGERLWVHKKWQGDAAAFTPVQLG